MTRIFIPSQENKGFYSLFILASEELNRGNKHILPLSELKEKLGKFYSLEKEHYEELENGTTVAFQIPGKFHLEEKGHLSNEEEEWLENILMARGILD
jgi:hypothetical protein